MEDVDENETIRDKYGETGHNDFDAHLNEKYQITKVDICAGELEQRKDIPEIMVDGECSQKVSLNMHPVWPMAPENAIK